MQEILSFGMCTWICGKENDEGYLEMRKDKIRILHIAQAAGGVDRYIRMLLKYLDKEKFENILVCSQDFREEDYKNLVDLLALQILASKITVYITRMGGHLTCDALQRKKQCTQLLRK